MLGYFFPFSFVFFLLNFFSLLELDLCARFSASFVVGFGLLRLHPKCKEGSLNFCPKEMRLAIGFQKKRSNLIHWTQVCT